MEQQRWQDASLWLKTILDRDAQHAVALRHMTAISRHLPLEDELYWWEKLLSLDPTNLKNRLGFVEAALQQDELLLAETLLDGISAEHLNRYEVLQLQAALARRLGDARSLSDLARKSLAVKPQDPMAKLLLLEGMLQQRKRQDATETSELIRELTSNPQTSLQADRVLLESLIRYREWDAAFQTSTRIIVQGQGQVQDLFRNLQLSLLRENGDILEALELFGPRFEEDPRLITKIAYMLCQNQKSQVALAWLEKISITRDSEFYIQLALIDTLYAIGRYDAARAELDQGESWGPNESYRLSYLARILKQNGNRRSSSMLWEQSRKLARQDPDVQFLLMNTVVRWDDWQPEANEMLWDVLQREEYAEPAMAFLRQRYQDAKDTENLFRLSRTRLLQHPGDDNNRNNYVMYALLLNQDTERAYEMAKELYQKYRGNFIPITTYAFALYHQGNLEAALGVMGELGPRAQEIPELAHYYAVYLKAAGRHADAEIFLEKSEGAQLLDEELALLGR
ncbi:MAG: hypothetical protein AAF571_13415, partial [Verrucomicrobiota bacterium]